MASNDEYQQQMWNMTGIPKDRFGSGEESWMESEIKKQRIKFKAELERLFYTADEGSTLDRIWKKEFKNKNK